MDSNLKQGGGEYFIHNGQVSNPDTRKWKYKKTLKHLLPWRPAQKDKRKMPANNASLFSFVTIHWLNKLMVKAYKSGLEQDDLYELAPPDTIQESAERMVRIWDKEVQHKGKRASLLRASSRFLLTRSVFAMLFFSISTLLQFVGPTYIQRLLLSFLSDETQPLSWGVSLVLVISLTQLLRNLCFGAAYSLNLHTATRLQGALQYLVYSKVLRLRASDEGLLGEILTVCSSEQERIFDTINLGTMMISAPIMIAVCVVYTYSELGLWALLGSALILSFYPIMGWLGAKLTSIRSRTVEHTDKRINMMAEILNSIKLIKMYAWEESFAKNLRSVRDQEQRELRKAIFISSFSTSLSPAVPILAVSVTFIVQTATGSDLSTTQAFTVYCAFQTLNFIVSLLPLALKSITEARVAIQKIEKILSKPEYQPRTEDIIQQNNFNAPAIEITSANFTWEEVKVDDLDMFFENTAFDGNVGDKNTIEHGAKNGEHVDALTDVNLTVNKGQIIGVSGAVGSGKSSLLSAITGDMYRVRGELRVRGSLAIVTQQAWIFNETLRENILFGLPYHAERYREVLSVCSLHRDLELLANGDLTEISERGANLSGGQKQRVSLARAVYADKDIYLLDDPLSAVDSRVAKHIFNKCIKEYLKRKTVILVTHGVQYLETCDQILFMKDGVITERGTHEQLISMKGDYSQLLSFDQTRDRTQGAEGDNTALEEEPPAGEQTEDGGVLTSAEQHRFLGISGYLRYLKFCGGYCAMFNMVGVGVLFTAAVVACMLILQAWLSAGDGLQAERERNATRLNETYSREELRGSVTANEDLLLYQLAFGSSFLLVLGAGLAKAACLAHYLTRGASRLHDAMFRGTLRCPTAFFDVTPAGRVLQRFSKDMDEIDSRMPYHLEYVLHNGLRCLAMMLMVCAMYPVYTVVLAGSVVALAFLGSWLDKGISQNKMLDNFRRAPVISHISSTVAGVSVIRTFGRQEEQMRRFCRRVDSALASDLVFRASVRWFTFRMDMVSVLMVTLASLCAVLARRDTSAAQGGLAFTSIFSVCNLLPYAMQMLSELQARFTSVERVLEYTSELPEEADIPPPGPLPLPLPARWPQRGEVVLEGVELRYRPGLPLALRGVTATLRPGEKVGVVGRTGAGKSSLLSALLRLTELSAGRVLVDGVDIAHLGLGRLRAGIAVIPQDPVLFQGTMRYNLDPLGQHDDARLLEALERAHVKERVSLMAPVSGGGRNLSAGERQLVCLARAILRGNKILLLDEATASVDVETDFLIQRTIREAFEDCTVLTVAHRLHSVAAHDRVMVMEAGRVVELDTPAALLAREDSVFRQMCRAAGMA